MKYTYANDRSADFDLLDKMEAPDVASFLEALAIIDDDTQLCHRADERGLVADGAWVRRGTYKLKHGSFIDPSDLSVYGGQYYDRDDENGRYTCLEVGFGEDAPEDARACQTVGQLRALLVEAVSPESCEAATAQEAPSVDEASDLRILQPSPRFEYHGKLVRGCSAALYALIPVDVDEGAYREILLLG